MKRINAVILDWAGTTVDFGSFAPTQIFVEAFRQAFGVEITLDEARVPMGLGKWQHIDALGKLPAVAARWQAKWGRAMTADDIDAIYAAFMPLQIASVVNFAAPIDGVVDTVAQLRAEGIRIGSCSGYPRAVMEKLVPAAAAYGYSPDNWVATDDLAAGGRPGPWMALQNVIALGIDSVAHCVKVDDAAPGIVEGINAGMWSVGLAVSGNAFGATREAFLAMPAAEVAQRRERAAAKLYAAGAHYVVDTLADLPGVIAQINARLTRGERP
ncbi:MULTISPECIES: phosphonoacetaldehyde hydrolase [Edwardsiella]|uniref:Phosphonoacetaldehyde hydrolase n=2 Tax=Edwardsiella anguillarum TaxID=1821960 RepID=A0A076LR53_9GAMM|nr:MULTISPECIES: phosphonoacetaldehyde hydrolase [Edwardsiella]AKM48586.1 phosphonoacetaldehyde hydrolase [Edwardsiella sp. EA181011]AIJ09162.1 Phosphonoacetaldehyde hydrolase [Edwardsiella anguillarum ET080813]AKR77092.1 phosphonoacetaldehyde hydrolase [Edwardsiella sp. LADL05-105]KAB0589988.1 phosphonoacetaldehyde hydrolase [Edwardsiella anguillarum]UOU80237.1 phosphonoacetaldehyde hydrolase [Edwardsiella anguillarum]